MKKIYIVWPGVDGGGMGFEIARLGGIRGVEEEACGPTSSLCAASGPAASDGLRMVWSRHQWRRTVLRVTRREGEQQS